jgi:predicted enzyme related to lactoylglutathione lyase
MAPRLPTPIPQIPVSDLERAISFYQSRLRFALDWRYEDSLAGVSREETRLFLDQVVEGPLHPVRVWLNLASASEVDALHRDWQNAGVPILSAPEQEPWGIYEFIAEDCDGNSYRVFYDTKTPMMKKGG